MVEIKGHDVSKELAILEGIEARLEAIPTGTTNGSLFRIMDNWLIRDVKIWDFLPYPVSRSRGINRADLSAFPNRRPFSVLYKYLFADSVRARTSASSICFKNNLRAFYLSKQRVTLWIASRQKSSEVLRKSMALRDQYNRSSGFLTPKIIAQDIESNPPYILEELITGRPFGQPKDYDLLVDKVLPSLFRFYEREFIRHHPAAEIYDVSLIYQEVTKAVSKFKDEKKWLRHPERLLKAVEQCLLLSDEKLPLCVGHGDLCRTNLIVAADCSIVLLDWEHSRELPIAEELIRLMSQLVRKHPHLTRRVMLMLRQLTEDPIAMSPKRQFLLASLEMVARASNLGMYRQTIRWLKLALGLITLPE